MTLGSLLDADTLNPRSRYAGRSTTSVSACPSLSTPASLCYFPRARKDVVSLYSNGAKRRKPPGRDGGSSRPPSTRFAKFSIRRRSSPSARTKRSVFRRFRSLRVDFGSGVRLSVLWLSRVLYAACCGEPYAEDLSTSALEGWIVPESDILERSGSSWRRRRDSKSVSWGQARTSLWPLARLRLLRRRLHALLGREKLQRRPALSRHTFRVSRFCEFFRVSRAF